MEVLDLIILWTFEQYKFELDIILSYKIVEIFLNFFFYSLFFAMDFP